MADQYVWTSADGDVTVLSDWDAGYVVTDATGGLRSPTYTVVADEYAGLDGSSVQSIRAAPAEPTLGMFVSAATPDEFRAKLRGLVRSMRPKAGPGVLTVSNETGESRSLTCYCMGGQEGIEARFDSWFKAALKFYAPDPWWYGDTRLLNVGLGAATPFFPVFPLKLSPSTVQGQFAVDLSDTDAPTYPVWTVIGPGTSLTLTNVTTGRTLTVNATLTGGDSMIVDTRPGFQSVRRGDGTNLGPSIVGDPALWPLIEGVNVVTANLAGATSASRILGEFRPRYSGI